MASAFSSGLERPSAVAPRQIPSLALLLGTSSGADHLERAEAHFQGAVLHDRRRNIRGRGIHRGINQSAAGFHVRIDTEEMFRQFFSSPKARKIIPHTAKPTVGSRRSRPYQRLRPVNEEGSRPRSGMTESDSRLISRTVIPCPSRDHVGEFEDHCAFDGVPL